MLHGTAQQHLLDEAESITRQSPSLGGGAPPPALAPPVSNARLGMLMLIAAETMLFVGLIGAYLMFRLGSVAWPSAQLYLPISVTLANTFVLLCSGFTMRQAVRAASANDRKTLTSRLGVTTLLGVLFLTIQGYEWLRLIEDGLTIATGIYGATFYTLIGCHALHVFVAVVWLVILLVLTRKRAAPIHVEICGMYWRYVCALWVVLFALVYLN